VELLGQEDDIFIAEYILSTVKVQTRVELVQCS